MPKYFPGLTHVIVRTPMNDTTMKNYDAISFVSLCFTTDESKILVTIKKMPGPVTGVFALLPGFVAAEKSNVVVPGIQGKMADELKVAALIAFDVVKQKYGLKYNKRYKVVGGTVEELI